jgi:hypothetical protein
MFSLLNSYLFQHKSISIPGLGTIYLENLPASIDTSTQNMLPPAYYFRFDRYSDSPDRQFFSFLASQQQIADYEALRQYNDFSHQVRERINQNEAVSWEGIGILKKDSDGNIAFESAITNPSFMQPVPARKVIHPDSQHVILVGDTERTSTEMNAWLNQEQMLVRRRPWWLYALIIGILSILGLVFYFSSHGWNMDSTGNQKSLQTEK